MKFKTLYRRLLSFCDNPRCCNSVYACMLAMKYC